MITPSSLPSDERQRLLASPTGAHWQKVGLHHHHGVAIPLTALRSERRLGCGTFYDLMPLIDWCAHVGMDLIQLLPINDSGIERSPYNAITAYGLNPTYLTLSTLPHLDQTDRSRREWDQLAQLDARLEVCYEEVHSVKKSFLESYLERHKDKILNDPNYQEFTEEWSWLAGYGLFRALLRRERGTPWWDWSAELRDPTAATLEHLKTEFRDEISYYSMLQYLCDLQLRDVKAYAQDKQVMLMGDIPILVNRNSADVWLHRPYFDLNYSAGAPPDMFNVEGQNWGFPLYHWEALLAEDFSWWKTRLHYAERFYHAYRLDHVIGFFRLFGIPPGKTGVDGVFIPQDVGEAVALGDKLLRVLFNTSQMLPVGEDLGVIPQEATQKMRELGLPGTKVMRWEKGQHNEFLFKDQFAPANMTTVSTHDSEPLQLWWEVHFGESQALCHQLQWHWQPQITTDQHYALLEACHQTSALLHVNPLQEYLALYPGLASGDPVKERINVPGTPSHANWSYRLRLPTEQWATHQDLANSVRRLTTLR